MNKLKTSAAFAFIIKLSSMGLALLLNLFLARVLDIDDFGIFIYAFSATRLLSIAGNFGLNKLLIREIAIYESREQWFLIKTILKWSDIVVILTSSILTAAAIFLSSIIFTGDKQAVFNGLSLCLISLPVISLASLRSSTLKGFRAVNRALIPEFLISPAITIIIPVILYLLNPDNITVQNAILCYVLSTVVSFIVSEILVRQELKSKYSLLNSNQTDLKSVQSYKKAWLKSAFPLMMVNAAQIIFARVDIILLGSLAGPAFAGIYSVLAYGVQIIAFIRFAVNVVLEPNIAKKFGLEGVSKELQSIVQKAARLVFGTSLIFSVIIILSSSIWLSWFGEAFTQHRTALILLTVGELVNASAAPAWKLLIVTGNEKLIAINVIFCAALNTILNIILIPQYGINGAAFATVLSIIVNNIFMVFWTEKRIGIRATIFI